MQEYNDKLKKCPFCGEEVNIDVNVVSGGFAEFYIQHFCNINGVEIDIELHDSNIYAVINTWNTNALTTRI